MGNAMKRRIVPKPQEEAVNQALVDYKRATLEVLLSKIPESSTFAQLGNILGYSHEWVRVRLVKQREKLFRVGRRYKVPRGVAVELVRSEFIWRRISAAAASILSFASRLASAAIFFVVPIQFP